MTRRFLSVEDLRDGARARLPRFIFDFIDGGAGDETAVRRNRQAFADVPLLPRVLDLPDLPSISTSLWGETFAAPFGIAPMGMADLAWPGTDRALARAARDAGVPLGVSMVSSTDVAELAAIAGPRTWLQVYAGVGAAITEELLSRAEGEGVTTLVFTVDANYPGLRLRDRRNGFPAGLRSAGSAIQLARHPAWALATWRAGPPRPAQLERALDRTPGAVPLVQILAGMARAPLHWELVDRLRSRWRARLIVKGILAPDDAIEAKRRGADGVVVSNHGGRQLAGVVASIDAVSTVRAAVGADYPLLLDSGVGSGEDVAKALALGADMVLLGRPFLYAAAAMGPERGPAHLTAMLRDETIGALAQLGARDIATLKTDKYIAGRDP